MEKIEEIRTMTIKESIKWAREALVNSCERPQYEAELLLAYHLQKERIYLVIHDNKIVEELEAYKALISRRVKHEPYEYIVGEASFYDISLSVEEGVLIPRPETEILIDLVAQIIEKESIINIAEIGIGSGAISIVLARKFPHLRIIASDICDKPIEISQKNIQKYKVSPQIEVRKSSLLDGINEPIELVVSNPPYIAEDFILASNVIDYEPKEALFGGRIGDELLKQIILDSQAKGVKYLACEMGYDQKAPIQTFVDNLSIKSITFYQDLAGFDRGFLIGL